MGMTDPIADILTRIRNASQAHMEYVDAPYSKMKEKILGVMKEEGYIRDFKRMEGGVGGTLRVLLKYDRRRFSAITGIRRMSSPGLRIYVGVDDIPKVQQGLGISILSTPQGVMVDRKARQNRVGGELLLSIW
jgi:small subunit ribosomal protein S8